jgi:1-carboxybiuret hydrolase subunit AtzG-like protein
LSIVSVKTQFDLESFVDVCAATIGLSIADEYRAGVVESFRQLAASAELVMSFPLPDEVDPATVFRA